MRVRFVPLGLVCLGLLASACSSGGDRLTVYSGRTSNLIGPLLEQFSDETGIAIDVRYGDSADLALLIDTEGDNTGADVFISQSPGAVGFLEEQDRLAPLGEAELDLVDDDLRSDDGHWVGLSGRIRTLVYNTELVDESEIPDSVLDLTGEQFRGRVAVAPTNGSFQDFVTAMRIELGDDVAEEWLQDMAANNAQPYSNNTAIVEAVTRGEVPMGLVNHYYLERTRAENPNVSGENHFFTEGDIGSLLITTAASIVDGTDRSDDARALIRFLLSEQAQRFFSQETFEYPLARGVEQADALPPLSGIPTTRIDLDDLGDGLARTAELIQDSGLDRN